jgi:epoxyqueuosine reductase
LKDRNAIDVSVRTAGSDLLSAASIKETLCRLGADAVGIARASPVKNKDRFLDWLASGFGGEMHYLSRNVDQRINPKRLMAGAESIITVGMSYFPTPEDRNRMQPPFKVAKYAWGEDYHSVLRAILNRLRTSIRSAMPRAGARVCVDTAPFMDKYWAHMAGLGWQGKHTGLVSRQFGNWLVIGSLIVDVRVDQYDRPSGDYCGRCTACLDACPTGALTAPYRLDATRCISYWTIESRADEIPTELARKMGSWVFGCDICLDVCPFNRFSEPRRHEAFRRRPEITLIETGKARELTESEFNNKFGGSPVNRPRLRGIRRNIQAARTAESEF